MPTPSQGGHFFSRGELKGPPIILLFCPSNGIVRTGLQRLNNNTRMYCSTEFDHTMEVGTTATWKSTREKVSVLIISKHATNTSHYKNINKYNRKCKSIMWVVQRHTKANGQSRQPANYMWTFELAAGEEMAALGWGGHIWYQLDVRIQNMCILAYVWIFFPKPLFFLLHFRCDNSSFFRRFLDQNNCSMYQNQEPMATFYNKCLKCWHLR